jgi:hypothetical protein
MKKIDIYKLILMMPIVVFLNGCEDFLDRYPSSSVSGVSIYSSLETCQAALNGLYNDLQSGDLTGRSSLLRGDLKSCDFFLLTSTGQYFTTEYSYQDNVTNYGVAGVIWAQGYQIIKDCNVFIDGISGLEGDADVINDMKAQASTIKAIAFIELLQTFCYPPAFTTIDSKYSLGIPIVRTKEDNVSAIEELPERAQLTKVFEYLEELLIDAADNINPSRAPGYYISSNAINGILANVYLYQEKWPEAASVAVQAATGRSMMEKSDFLTENYEECNDEAIFELRYTLTDNLADRMPGYVANKTVNENGRHDASSKGYGDIGASDAFIALLNENPEDIRIQLLHEDKTSTAPLTATDLIQGVDGYSARYYYKYIGGRDGNVYLHNTPYIRLPEILLTAAEAYSETGTQDGLALDYLNQVYSKRTGTVLTDLTGDDLKTAIFNERRRELALEGHGIWDFLRKNRAFTRDISHHTILTIDPATSAGRDDVNFYKVVAPIPITEMDANPNIRNQQNPGYSAYQGSN